MPPGLKSTVAPAPTNPELYEAVLGLPEAQYEDWRRPTRYWWSLGRQVGMRLPTQEADRRLRPLGRELTLEDCSVDGVVAILRWRGYTEEDIARLVPPGDPVDIVL